MEGEEHRSTAFSTLYHGLRKEYQYFPELQFSNLEAFRKAGGLLNVYDYYEKRSKQFGFQAIIADWTMFSLIRNAIRENDVEQFERFVNEFTKSGFLSRLRINRSISIASFYLKNERYNQAIKIFELLAEKHPDSDKPLLGLGDTYKAMKDKEKASMFYKKAKEVANQ